MSVNGKNSSFNCVASKRASVLVLIYAAIVCALLGCKDERTVKSAEVARFVRSAESYQAQGQFKAAMLEAKNAIQKDPANPEGYRVLAETYSQVGAFGASQKLLEPVIKKMPSLTVELAEAYVANKKYRSALTILGEYSADNAGSNVKKQTLIARSAIYLGDTDTFGKSINALKELKHNPNDIALLEAESLLALGNTEAAQAKIGGIDDAANANIKTLILLGNFALYQNKSEEAEGYFSKALSLLPKTDILTVDKATVLKQLTESLIRQGKTSEAYRYQKLLADANPESQAAQEKFNDAMEFFKQGKFAEAERILTDIREQFPQDKNTAMLLGMAQYQQGDNKSASELFDQYIDPETATPSVIQAAALAKFRSNKMDDAIELLKKSAESQPDNAEILATYGLALLDKDATSVEAQKAIEKSLALNANQQRLRLALAKRDFALKNVTQGLGQLQKAYTEQPLDFVIQQTYFKALIANGKLDVLKREVDDFKKKNPGNPRSIFLEGWYKFIEKDYASAQVAFEKAINTDGNTEKNFAYAGLAEVYVAQHQFAKAISTLKALIELDPTQIPPFTEWMRLEQQENRMEDAENFLVNLEKTSDKWQPSVVLAQVYFSKNSYADAIKHIELALVRSDKNEQVKQIAANLYFQNGVALLKNNVLADAKINMLKALNLYPDNMSYLKGVVELEVSQRNTVEAQKVLDQFSGNADVAAERSYLQGVIRAAENNSADAIVQFKSSWSKRPMDITADAIFNFYQKNNDKAALDGFVEDWMVKLPQNPRPLLFKAVALQQKNDLSGSIDMYEKAIALAPNSLIALNNLACIYNDQKNPKAVDLALRAYQLDSNNPSVIDTYGWVLSDNDRADEAIDLLKKAAQLDPVNKDIQKHLADAKAKLKK